MNADEMSSVRNVWVAIYLVAFAIFFGGYFLGVQTSPYFPAFVVFCMAYGAGVLVFLWWSHRRQG